ncbi:MAG: hypothetical protein H0X13_13505 [Ramlibacter sp.]|nr:hypothetical protein [Ramlibacter sp.]
MNLAHSDELAAQYAQAIESERAAWHELQACRPGSQGRAQAWDKWAQAISQTNRAWRALSSRNYPTTSASSTRQAARYVC